MESISCHQTHFELFLGCKFWAALVLVVSSAQSEMAAAMRGNAAAAATACHVQ
jgi:hypothetical protein